MTVAGLTMAATPLALWMSPNKTSFYLALIICGIAYGVTVLLCRYGIPDDAAAGLKSDDGAKVTLKKFVQDNIHQPKPPKDE